MVFTGGLGYHYGAQRLGCTLVLISGGMTERQVQLINGFRAPEVLFATPSYALCLVDEFRAQGLDRRCSSLKLGLRRGAMDQCDARRTRRRLLDRRWTATASEVIGPGVAGECVETKDGLHIWEDHFYPEIVDPRTARAKQPDGERVELVLTSLTKEAMPTIATAPGTTRLLPGTARSMRRMEKCCAGRTTWTSCAASMCFRRSKNFCFGFRRLPGTTSLF